MNPIFKFTTDLRCMCGELETLEVEAELIRSTYSLPDRHDRGNVTLPSLRAEIVDVTTYDAATDRMAGVLDKLSKDEIEQLQELAEQKYQD